MRKNILLVLFLVIAGSCFAQKFEVIKEIKFGEPIQYYETWDPIEEGNPGILQMKCWKNQLILFDKDKHLYFNLSNSNQKREYKSLYNFLSFCQNDDILMLAEIGSINKLDLYITSLDIQAPNYTIDVTDIKDQISGLFYYTENKFFAKIDKSSFVYWDLLPDGKTKFHDSTQTQYELEDGLAEHLGISIEYGDVYFGENAMDLETAPNYINYWKDVKIKNKKYEWLSASFSTSFCKEGIDKRGLTYYTSVGNGYHIDLFAHPEIPFEYIVAVLDPWTHEVYICELPPGNWNPARNSKGFIAVNSSCIDFDGNFYLTDCNKEKGCYEIKKLSNDWLKKYDFYKREVGRMNANHIPLQLEAKSSAKNNGYNFDHEYLWILEHKSDWCKVRKVDGREGWVETRYINFDEGNKASSSYKTSVNTNVSENRIMACNDNLRLRKEEATSSAVITTMQKGTKVKILKLGKAETIDGISSNWVQVEVLADAKDKDGATIKAGTRGWCYGGYLD